MGKNDQTRLKSVKVTTPLSMIGFPLFYATFCVYSVDAPTTFFGKKKKANKANFEAFTLVQASLMPNDLGLFWPILAYFRPF